MRLSSSNNIIRINSPNLGCVLSLTVVMTPLAILFCYLGGFWVIYGPFSVASLLIGAGLLCIMALAVLMPWICWQTLNAYTTVDRNLNVVTVKFGKKTSSHHIGVFEKILMQPVNVPEYGLQYHAYLIGTEDKCALGIVAATKGQFYRKLEPVSKQLNVPIEESVNTEDVFDVISRNSATA